MNGVQRIRVERRRQISKQGEGWSRAHDAQHIRGELALAAATYALPPETRQMKILTTTLQDILWPDAPYSRWSFKRTDRIDELAKAGALIAAEIDRLQALPAASQGETP